MCRYTFCVKLVIWLGVIAAIGVLVYGIVKWRQRREELERASEQRSAAFMAEMMTVAKAKNPTPLDAAALAKQRLLLEAAAKAGEAGEPVLSIQLYARLLARYPDSAFAAQAREAVEAQKKNLPKG
jgi:uncharacterized iron-regulated membrane protein